MSTDKFHSEFNLDKRSIIKTYFSLLTIVITEISLIEIFFITILLFFLFVFFFIFVKNPLSLLSFSLVLNIFSIVSTIYLYIINSGLINLCANSKLFWKQKFSKLSDTFKLLFFHISFLILIEFFLLNLTKVVAFFQLSTILDNAFSNNLILKNNYYLEDIVEGLDNLHSSSKIDFNLDLNKDNYAILETCLLSSYVRPYSLLNVKLGMRKLSIITLNPFRFLTLNLPIFHELIFFNNSLYYFLMPLLILNFYFKIIFFKVNRILKRQNLNNLFGNESIVDKKTINKLKQFSLNFFLTQQNQKIIDSTKQKFFMLSFRYLLIFLISFRYKLINLDILNKLILLTETSFLLHTHLFSVKLLTYLGGGYYIKDTLYSRGNEVSKHILVSFINLILKIIGIRIPKELEGLILGKRSPLSRLETNYIINNYNKKLGFDANTKRLFFSLINSKFDLRSLNMNKFDRYIALIFCFTPKFFSSQFKSDLQVFQEQLILQKFVLILTELIQQNLHKIEENGLDYLINLNYKIFLFLVYNNELIRKPFIY